MWCTDAFIPWWCGRNLQGPVLGALCHCKMLVTDTSLVGREAVLKGYSTQGLWRQHHLSWHINNDSYISSSKVLPPEPQRQPHPCLYEQHKSSGGLRLYHLCRLVHQVLLWSQGKLFSHRAVYISHTSIREQTACWGRGWGNSIPRWWNLLRVSSARRKQICSHLWVWPLRGISSWTILNARAPAMRESYSFQVEGFTSWYKELDPVNCLVNPVLEFLKSCFSVGLSPSILKVYVVVIAAFQALSRDGFLERHHLITRLLCSTRRMKPNTYGKVPAWDLAMGIWIWSYTMDQAVCLRYHSIPHHLRLCRPSILVLACRQTKRGLIYCALSGPLRLIFKEHLSGGKMTRYWYVSGPPRRSPQPLKKPLANRLWKRYLVPMRHTSSIKGSFY